MGKATRATGEANGLTNSPANPPRPTGLVKGEKEGESPSRIRDSTDSDSSFTIESLVFVGVLRGGLGDFVG
jgi:hypothetical protein